MATTIPKADTTSAIEQEQILWEGYPKPRFKFTLLAGGFIHIPYLGWWLLALVVVALGGLLFVEQGNWEWSAFFGGLWLLVFLFPDFIKWIYKNGLLYQVTAQGIIYDLGRNQQYQLPIQSIRYIEVENHSHDKTTIHFFTTGQPAFQTHNYHNLKKRAYPTFECIEQGAQVVAILEGLGLKRLK